MPWRASGPALDSGQGATVLDFPEVLSALAEHAQLERSAEALRALRPLADRGLIDARRARVRDWLRLLEGGLSPELGGLADPGALLDRARREGAELSGPGLRSLAGTLRALATCGCFLHEHAEEAPTLAADWGSPADLSPLADGIERCLDDDGELRDDASPALARIRAQIREAREQVRVTLDGLIRGRLESGREDVRPRIRSGRLVLPVRREQRSRLAGIVHDESASGRTLFVEPLETVELNNRVTSLLAEEAKETARILRDLTRRAGQWAGEITSQVESFAGLDLPLAVARFWLGKPHAWAEWDEADGLRLAGARHPLLGRYLPADQKLVPLSVELAPELRLLLVTGPNTGGKTVLLKTLGLAVLMNQCGLPLPAEDGTRLPLLGRVFVDIGDEQSLVDSRSTFSAHLEHLTRMVDHAEPDSLILVDEIGDGTDPEEGAALARAIMSHWLGRGARAVVSTHFGILKGFAQETDGAANAAMEFDPVARRPLYTLRFGVPGSSRALATARRLGMDPVVLSEAERLLGEEALSLEALLERLERETREATRSREEGEASRQRYESLEADYKDRLTGVRREEKRILADARREGLSFLTDARREIEAVVRALRESEADRESIQAAHEKLAEIGRRLDRVAPAPALGEALTDWRPGDRVRLRSTGRSGEIVEAAGEGRLRVRIGGLSLILPLEELVPVSPAPAAEAVGGGKAYVDVSYRAETPDSYRLDLRGLTVEEALEQLDGFLDGAVLAAFHFVEIIHGKGTGALRRAVQDALRQDSRVREHHLADQNQGGSGATVAVLTGGGGGDPGVRDERP